MYQAINFLTTNQNSDGGWGFRPTADAIPDDSSNTYVTAIVSFTLQQFSQTTALASAINKATSYLVAHQNTDGGFGSSPSTVYETALAYKALSSVITDATVLGKAVNYLTTTQASNGSWNDDPYSTALALQALHLAESKPTPPPPSPTTGTVSGTVIDASTNQPLSGVTIQWSGSGGQGSASTTTSSSGMFSLTNIPQGSQQITFSLNGYANSMAAVTVTAGSIINIGSVPLSVVPNTGIIQGTVKDSSNGNPLSGVVITITGAMTWSATTTADGTFKITGITSGSVTISASKYGYTIVSAASMVTVGETLIFSPSLTVPPLPVTTGGLMGKVINSATGLPLQGSTISVSGAKSYTASTDSSGNFALSAVNIGSYVVSVSATGYGARTYPVTVTADVTTDFGSIALTLNPTTGTVQGTVTDASTGAPISGVAITLSGASTWPAVTIADGSYKLEGITPGAVTFSATREGYGTVTGAGTVVAGGTLILNVSLTSTPPATTGEVKGVFTDKSTGQPVSGAVVTLTPSSAGPIATATSDATGAFIIPSATSGNNAISVAASGYISQTSTLTVVSGVTTNLGTMPLTLVPLVTTVTGTVIDAASGAALPNVNVSVVGTSFSARTDSNGAYTLTGITALTFGVKASATGYNSSSYNVTTTSHGAYAVDFSLGLSQTGGLRITSLFTDKQSYSASENVLITATIENASSAAVSTIIEGLIIDNAGNAVALTTPANPDTPSAPFWVISIEPLSSVTVSMTWNSARFSPGDHQVNVKATTPSSNGSPGSILAQQGLPISIQPFVGIANSAVKSDPTFVYTGATAPLKIGLKLANKSNIPVDLTIQYDIKRPSGAVLQSGTISAALSLDMITTTIPLTLLNYTFVENGEYPIHAIVYNGGVIIKEVQTVFVVLDNIRIEPSRTVTPNSLLPNGTGKVRTTIQLSGKGEGSFNPNPTSTINVPQGYNAELFADGLSSPVSMRVNGNDELYVAESTMDRIVKVSPTGSVSTFANSWWGSPLDLFPGYRTKIDIDKNGNLYVSCPGSYDNPYNPSTDTFDAVAKITPQGVISILARQYFSPNYFNDIQGLTVSPDGQRYLFIGDTWNRHDILKVDLAANTSTIFATSVYDPVDMLFDQEGNLIVSMSGSPSETQKIYRFAPDGTRTVYNDTIEYPVAMAWGPDGFLYVVDAATRAVYTIDPSTNTVTPFATGFTEPYDLDFDSQGNLYVLEYGSGQIIKILTTAAVFTEVRLIDTIPTKDVEFVLSSATKTPYSVTLAGEDAVVEWRLNSVTAGRDRTISYDLNLFNLLPGEDRLVDRSLELIYKDLNNQEIRVALPPLTVHVLSSVFDTALFIDKPQYQAQSDVGIGALIENRTGAVWSGVVDILIEDAAGNAISHVATTAVDNLKPIGLYGWAYRMPVSVTASQVMIDAVVKADVDFAAIMQTLGIAGKTIDKNSIRVLEIDAVGNVLSESPAQVTFTSDIQAIIVWLLKGTTTKGTARHYFIYFDMMDHNPKTPSLNTKLPTTVKLIAYSDDIGRVFIIESNGDGTFGTARLVSDITPADDINRGVVLDDFNNDGYVDIITGSGVNGDIYYFQNKADGSNTFSSGVIIGTIDASGYIMGIAAGDFDADGNKDFVVSGSNNILYLFKGRGDGTFNQTVLVSPPGTSYLRGKATGDVDNDGKLDLVVTSYGSGMIHLYKGNGDGTFASPIQIGANGTDPYGLIVGDFDEDGMIDIIQRADYNAGAYLFKGHGDGTFAAPVLVPSLNPGDYTAFTTGDFNNDGHLDIIAVTLYNQAVEFHPGNGNGTFGPKTTIGATASYSLGISSSPALPKVLPVMGAPEAVTSHQMTFNFTWNTGSTISGNYQVHALWSDEMRTVSGNRASFAILPDTKTAAKIVTDKASYNPNETATLTSTVMSKSMNYVMEKLTAKISIQGTVGSMEVYAETKTIATLMPEASFTFKNYWNTGTYPAGVYPVVLEVKDSTGALITTGTATVTITDVIQPSAALRGTLSVDKQSVLAGEPVAVSYSITNTGNADLPNVGLSVLTVHVVTQTVYDAITSHATISMGGTYAGSGQINTQTFSAKDYLLILQTDIGGIKETIAGSYFRVEGAPTVPALSAPAAGSDVQTLTPSLTVNNASDPNDDKLTYEFEVYADSGLTTLIAAAGGIAHGTGTTAWQVPTELTENSTYYWRSRAYDGKLYGEWMHPLDSAQGVPASFRVNVANDPPTAPTIASPADNTEVSTLTPVLTVNNATDPDSASLTYNFQVALDPEFTQIVALLIGVFPGPGTTSWQVSPALSENTWYYWRAQADDWLDVGPWSIRPKFFVNTTNNPPTKPVILSPGDNTSVASLNVSIVLQNSTDPDSPVISYYFEVDTVPTFDSVSIIRSGLIPGGPGTTTWQAIGLLDNTQYYVHAMASDGSAGSGWPESPVKFFVNTANDAPATPTIANPSNGAGVSTFTPLLSVHNATDLDRDALTYEFEVCSDAAFTSRVAWESGIVESAGTTSWTVPVALTENQKYYWRARAFDGQLVGGWAEAWFVVNTANDAPGAPTIITPLDGGSVDTATPTLKVQNALDPDSDHLTYEFEVYNDNGTTLVWSKTGVSEVTAGYTSVTIPTALSNNTVYQWQSRAYDGDRDGPWTAKASFTVHLPQTGITVDIEFEPETLNKKSHGDWVTVEIELPHGYKASDIDISSIRLEGTVRAEPWPYEKHNHHYDHGCEHEHAEHDHSELKVKFRRSDVIAVLPAGAHVPVHVTGRIGTTTFEGVDIIRVIP